MVEAGLESSNSVVQCMLLAVSGGGHSWSDCMCSDLFPLEDSAPCLGITAAMPDANHSNTEAGT